jgi:integrase/recombinase XerC
VADPQDPIPAPIVRSALTLEAAVQALVDNLTIRKLAPATMTAYRCDLATIVGLLPARDGGWTVDQLTGPVLRGAFAAFAAGHAPASVARARSTWTALFDLLVADDHLTGSAMAAVPPPRQPPRAPKPLLGWDKDTVERLVESVMSGERPGRTVWPELDCVVIALLLGTGLRSAELLGLNLGTYEIAAGDAVVRVVGKAPNPAPSPFPNPSPISSTATSPPARTCSRPGNGRCPTPCSWRRPERPPTPRPAGPAGNG